MHWRPIGRSGIEMRVIADLAGIAAITVGTFAVVIGGPLLAAALIRMALA